MAIFPRPTLARAVRGMTPEKWEEKTKTKTPDGKYEVTHEEKEGRSLMGGEKETSETTVKTPEGKSTVKYTERTKS
jgi:hypothetical protein